MSKGIYEAVWHSSWKVELTIDDDLFRDACEGIVQARAKIVHRFKNRASKVHDKKLEVFIDWDDPHFDIKRVRDAPAKKRASRPRATMLPEEPSCTCPDSCFMCDIGNHYQCRNCPRTR